jgi:predicted SprT family Zn-dependent metalloprotease
MTLHYTEAQVRNLAVQKLWEHGLGQQGWKFVLDRAVRRAGQCRYSRKEVGVSRAYIAAATKEAVLDTILHEVAHALAGHSHGHDATWRQIHRSIGGNGKRCVQAEEMVKQIEGRYKGECIKCHGVSYMHRRPRVARSCGKCNPVRFDQSCVVHYTDTQTGRLVEIGPRSRTVWV